MQNNIPTLYIWEIGISLVKCVKYIFLVKKMSEYSDWHLNKKSMILE
jgi:hypothetical protein